MQCNSLGAEGGKVNKPSDTSGTILLRSPFCK